MLSIVYQKRPFEYMQQVVYDCFNDHVEER